MDEFEWSKLQVVTAKFVRGKICLETLKEKQII